MKNGPLNLAQGWSRWLKTAQCASVIPRCKVLVVAVASGFAFTSLAGCGTLSGYETEWFAPADVRVIHSQRHCKDAAAPVEQEIADAELVLSRVEGLGSLVATRRAWELQARQLATELDADIAVVRPCEGEVREWQWEVAQTEVWRTRDYEPAVREEPPVPGATFSAPEGATYGARLQHLYTCLELAEAATAQASASNRARLSGVDATEFFSSGRYFPGYAKIDRYYRPTRGDERRLSMIVSRRSFADWAAGRYLSLPPEGRLHFAEHYLVCLLDRGYRW